MARILVTGVAGFIGSHLAERMLARGDEVIGLDNLNDYDDVAESVIRVLDRPPRFDPSWSGERPDPGSSHAPYRLYNIGNHSPVELERFIATLEDALGRKAIRKLLPMQPGDVPATYADVEDLACDAGFRPATPIEQGIGRSVAWYMAHAR